MLGTASRKTSYSSACIISPVRMPSYLRSLPFRFPVSSDRTWSPSAARQLVLKILVSSPRPCPDAIASPHPASKQVRLRHLFALTDTLPDSSRRTEADCVLIVDLGWDFMSQAHCRGSAGGRSSMAATTTSGTFGYTV